MTDITQAAGLVSAAPLPTSTPVATPEQDRFITEQMFRERIVDIDPWVEYGARLVAAIIPIGIFYWTGAWLWLVAWETLWALDFAWRAGMRRVYRKHYPYPETPSDPRVWTWLRHAYQAYDWLIVGSLGLFCFLPNSIGWQISAVAGLGLIFTTVTVDTNERSEIVVSALAMPGPLLIRLWLKGTPLHYGLAVLMVGFVVLITLWGFQQINVRRNEILLRMALQQEKLRAEQANIAKSKFIAAASHDLRQPLHAMTLLADALVGYLPDADSRLMLARLQDSLKAMRKLFNALLDISRLDAGIVEPRLKDFQLSRLMQRLHADYAQPASEKNLEWHCPPTALVVRSDPVLLETILRNLIGNAINYTPQGHVTIACREENGEVRIEIEDSGVGIAPAQQTEIFREFHQLNNPERDGAKGLGLGLAIVERLARLLDHCIELRSAPGEGSCFSVVLPLGSAATLEDDDEFSEDTALASDLNGMVVLVIDDQAAVLQGMQALLVRWGCEVILADSEAAALVAVRQISQPLELIIADYRLREDLTGSQAINGVRRELGLPIPALIITGDTGPERLREAQASGHRLMNKPVPPARLRAYLRTVRRNQTSG